MPNGHGGIPWMGSPVLLLALLILLSWLRFSREASWTVYAAYPVAALFAWRFAWHLCLYEATGYDGGYTPPEEMKKARASFYRLSVVLIAVAIISVHLIW